MAVDSDARTARSGAVDSGAEYEVRVRALTITGRASAWTSDTLTPTASSSLGAPTDLDADGAAGAAAITFRMPTGPTLAYARLYRATSADFGTAVQVGGNIIGGLGQVMEIDDTGLSAGTKYYWARAFEAGGGSSPLAGPATAMVS